MARTRTRVRISHDLFRQVVDLPAVRATLARTAREVAARAQALARQENAEATISVEDGTRPKGRSYSRVVADDYADHEFGTAKRKRTRLLGRAAGTTNS
ncbi:hypothetical protein JNUCC0626_20040 [Lentzea sp. JNUCC 0626]|uniref:hypothetical protein n=1 Tax=Lentzea sp. JNUCC 0626 TaxID=3367513 RepID=UPI00374A097F